jgi:aldose sugar dehydrogenase
MMPHTLRQLLDRSVLCLALVVACGDDDEPASTPDAGQSNGGRGGSAGSNAGGKGGAGAGGSSAAGAGAGGATAGRGGAGGNTAGRGGSGGRGGASGTPDAGPEEEEPTESIWKDLPAESVTAVAASNGSPNASGQTPAFEGQTRAPAPATFSKVNVQQITNQLSAPWAVEALRDGRFVVTEKSGTLRVVNKAGEVLGELNGVPAVDTQGQGGLLDVAIDERTDPMTLCITFSKRRDGDKTSTAASCTTATGDDNLTLEPFVEVFQQEPSWLSPAHYGSRFVFAPNDLVYITTGERSSPDSRVLAQNTETTIGKVVRLKRDGSAPSDNPFADEGEEAPKVWSYGHRNLQSAALDAQKRLWTVEHGPAGGDELNRPEAGKNYGWPVITYGEDYGGGPIGDGITSMDGMEQPIYYWDPVIAPSGMVVYTGKLFEAWRGDMLIGGLGAQALVHLEMKDDRVVSEERIPLGARVRDVTMGPDHAIYVVTNEDQSRLLRITPGE